MFTKMMYSENLTQKRPSRSGRLFVVLMAAQAVAVALLMAFAPNAEAQIQFYNCNQIISNTAVKAWGGNFSGQLGDGGTTNSNKAVEAKDLGGLRDVAAGGGHSLALTDECKVWAWGANYDGQLGDGTFTNSKEPVQVQNLSEVKAISTSFEHSLALKHDGSVWAWGWNAQGQLGDGTTTNSNVPVQVKGKALSSGVKAIAAGDNHSLALKEDGTVWAWGHNAYGQLGTGTPNDSTVPVKVYDLNEVKAIDAGGEHSLALKEDGTVWAWGHNHVGQLGTGDYDDHATPVKVRPDEPRVEDPRQPLSEVKAIAAGGNHSLALKEDGTVRAWGFNYWGQLGDAQTSGTRSNTPVKVLYLHGIKKIDADSTHSLSLNENGLVASWGANDFGQLGHGTQDLGYDYLSFPREVEDLKNVKVIDAGLTHNLAIVGESPVNGQDPESPDEDPESPDEEPYPRDPGNHK